MKLSFDVIVGFMPRLDEAMIARFSNGINTEVGEQGWRKLLLAFDGNDVVGHIDIRPHAEAHTEHRALLGMGVDRLYRKQGLGSRLISSIIAWTSENTPIELIDLWVLSSNVAAKQLYIKNGFIQCGEINDMYRIDGLSYSYTVMSRTVQE